MIRKILFTLFVLLLIVGLIGGYYISHLNDFQEDGELKISAFEEEVTVKRDENGIPYIFANSLADVIRGQGFVAAQDRVFQLSLYQKVIKGELASVIGEAGLTSDIEMRVLGVAENAERHARFLNESSRNYLQWYADGYNAYLENRQEEFPMELGLLGLEPAPFTVESMLSILHFIGFTHGQNYRDEVLSLNLLAELGAEKAAELLPLNINPDRKNPVQSVVDSLLGFTHTILKHPSCPSEFSPRFLRGFGAGWGRQEQAIQRGSKNPLLVGVGKSPTPTSLPQMGSNNWTTNAAHSQSNAPIVCNDPHLDARILPGSWLPLGLFCPEGKAIGGAIPGIPGILTGRTEHLAFGVTNAYGDSQDLFIETVDPNNSKNYLDNGESVPFEVKEIYIIVKGEETDRQNKVEVRYTKRGPVISDFEEFGIETGQTVSLRWSLREVNTPAIGIDRMLTAKDVYEMDSIAADIDVMYFNLVFADTKGNIAHRTTGQIPIRSSNNGTVAQTPPMGDWQGFIPKNEMPRQINPEKGWLGTSNHDVVPDDYPYYYSAHFSPNYRYKRMMELMESKPKISAEDHWSFILDVTNLHAKRFNPIFAKVLEGDETTKEMGTILQSWDCKDEVESVAASIFHVVHEELVRLILGDDLSADMLGKYLKMRYYWLERVDEIIEKGEGKWIDNQNTKEVEDINALLIEAGKRSKVRLTDLFGEDMEDWTWGKLHTLTFVSPLRQKGTGRDFLGGGEHPTNGSGETLNRGQYALEGKKYDTYSFSSMRMMADLSDNEKIQAVVSGGNAARQFHPYFDSQLEAWLSEKPLYWWFSEEKVEEHTVHELVLKP